MDPHPAPPVPGRPPVAEEQTHVDLPVTGDLPSTLTGLHAHITSGAAAGIVDGLTLERGRAVAYRRRRVQTDDVRRRMGRPTVRGPRAALDPSPHALVPYGGALLALADGALAYELTPELETVRRVDLAGAARGVGASPKWDAAAEELHLLSSPGHPEVMHHVITRGGLVRVSTAVATGPGPIRDLAVTPRHLVFLGHGFVGVVDRTDPRRPAWVTTPGLDPAQVAVAADAPDGVVLHTVGRGLVRWTVDADHGCTRATLDDRPQRSGRVNGRWSGGPHRFLYTVGHESWDAGAVLKHDLVRGTAELRAHASGTHVEDVVHVADAARGAGEDAGWLLASVRDSTGRAALVVLDAGDVTGAGVGTVHLPGHLPGGYAVWVPAGTGPRGARGRPDAI